ncbi:sentrin-specific protease 5-like isoform X2 [Acipenser ruthenus]|uniref:sentrin-specific protease 5-like isoform X2 n=1 Tax=Acipenser ruthenus TaxID=7906 RepID=UPI00156139E5|nr:sentrin-specific protease 5-like isoform X2 [Acipenser ruthenus]
MQHKNVTRHQRTVTVKRRGLPLLCRKLLRQNGFWSCVCFSNFNKGSKSRFLLKKKWQGAQYKCSKSVLNRNSISKANPNKSITLISAGIFLEELENVSTLPEEPLTSNSQAEVCAEKETDKELPVFPNPQTERSAGDAHFQMQIDIPSEDTSALLSVQKCKSLRNGRSIHSNNKAAKVTKSSYKKELLKKQPHTVKKLKKHLRSALKDKNVPLLMRITESSLFKFAHRCRFKNLPIKRHRKAERAKYLSRISTLRQKKLRGIALNFLSQCNTDSEDIVEEINSYRLLKLRKYKKPTLNKTRKHGLTHSDLEEMSSQDTAVPVEIALVETAENDPNFEPVDQLCNAANKMSGECKQTFVKKAVSPKSGKLKDDPGQLATDQIEHTLVNGTGYTESSKSTDKEVGLPVSFSNPFQTPLRDHVYCKSRGSIAGELTDESDGSESMTKAQLLTSATGDEEITELIHDYLEEFYGKYGSFIPLSENDVLENLQQVLNHDVSESKPFIFMEIMKYQAALANAPMFNFKVSYNKHTLTLEDLSTLDGQNWLNDQVINMYGELVMDAVPHKVHFFNSFFHKQLVTRGYEGVKRWTKKNILRYLLTEAKEKGKPIFQKGWKMIVSKCIPQQNNDSDCGVFVLQYCKCLALGKPFQFSQEDMPKVRKRIYKELCECRLLE